VTFSHRRVIELVQSQFVAVWESVAPVRTGTFDLGDGKKITGTTGGEMAIFFCTPDGWVFDLLPALHSPQVVYEQALQALETWRNLKHSRDLELAVTLHHTLLSLRYPRVEEPAQRRSQRERWRSASDPATAHLQRMSGSKASADAPEESVVVVEPGGIPFYRPQVHDLLSTWGLCTPRDLRRHVFEKILNEPLDDRGEFVYSFEVPRAFSLHTSPGDFDSGEERR
jgi:hypothetical protein